jgi:hypothetical protein
VVDLHKCGEASKRNVSQMHRFWLVEKWVRDIPEVRGIESMDFTCVGIADVEILKSRFHPSNPSA